jgi:DNA-binding transcriptional LysR family regulator
MFATAELQILAGLLWGRTLSDIGRELTLSHPSVGKALRAAEQKAGIPLVERQGRRLRLTPAGVRVARAAEAAVLQLRDIDTLLGGIKTGDRLLRVVASGTVSNYLLPPVISQLLTHAAEADVRIQTVNGSEVWNLLGSGEFDIGISNMTPPADLDAEHLYDDELCVCVAAGSDLSRQPNIDWSTLSGRTLIGPISNGAGKPQWRQFTDLGIQPGRRIEVSSLEVAKSLVEAGLGIALLYQSVALKEAAQGRIAMLRIPEAPLAVTYWLAAARTSRHLPLVEQFALMLHQHARSVGLGEGNRTQLWAVD